MIKRILRQFDRENTVRSASVLLIVTLTLSNVLGLFRDRFLAKNVSFSDLDIYFAAFRLPDTLFNFLILGAITSAFIPVFSDYLGSKEKLKAGYRLMSSMINIAAVLMIITAIIFYFIAPQAVRLVVPDFSAERLGETVRLSRWLMLTPIFFSVSYIIGSALNTQRRFFAYSLAPLVYNLSIILGAVWGAPRYGIMGVVYFVVIGAFLHLLIQIPALIRINFSYSFVMNWRDQDLQRVGRLMVPRSLSLGANQILLTVYTAIGSTLASGAIAAFNFANNIQTVPIVILGNSFAAAVFPTLSAKISEGDFAGFSRYLLKTIRAIAFLLIPSSVVMILLRAQFIRLILGSGKVGWGDTKMTALTLGFFSLSLLAQGLTPLLARAFFALKNTKIPMYITLASVVISMVLAYPLAKYYSIAGLALAYSLGNYFQMGAYLFAMKRAHPEIQLSSLTFAFTKIVFNSVAMGAITWETLHIAANWVDMHRYVGVLSQATIACTVALVSYLMLSYLFRSEELNWVLTRKINGRSDLGADSYAAEMSLENLED